MYDSLLTKYGMTARHQTIAMKDNLPWSTDMSANHLVNSNMNEKFLQNSDMNGIRHLNLDTNDNCRQNIAMNVKDLETFQEEKGIRGIATTREKDAGV